MNAPVKRSHFSELGRMLGWGPWSRIMTLWAFFDESGWHPTGAGLKKLTVGGCIASFEAWESLTLDWSNALKKMGIPMFHMTDFEKKNPPIPPYDDWTKQQRIDRLNALLEIIGTAKPWCCGFTNWARSGETTASIYERCAHDVLLELSLQKEEFSVVFAHHPEFSGYSPLHQMLMRYGYGEQIKSVTIGFPLDMCPLQAADIVAYEIRCEERWIGIPQRYPLKKLHRLGCTFRSSASADETVW
jgi:hypothetical protein